MRETERCLTTHPSVSAAVQDVLVAGPRQLNAVLDSRHLGVGILHDGQLEPRPGSQGLIIAEVLVFGFGKELHTLQPLNGGHIKGLETSQKSTKQKKRDG